jgi:diguanylate cyclase (GGDEF)-like protein
MAGVAVHLLDAFTLSKESSMIRPIRMIGEASRVFAVVSMMALFPCGFWSTAMPARAYGESGEAMTRVSAIRSLSAEEAGAKRRVHLRGVVTVVSGWKNSFFFEDAGGGSSSGISINRESPTPAVHPGQEVEIVGVTSAGRFAPLVDAQEVKVLGEGHLPQPPAIKPEELSGGRLDSQWAAIEGVVRTAMVKPIWGRPVLLMDVDVGAGKLVTARVMEFPASGWQNLPSSTVSIRGVVGTNFNDRRQFIGSRLFVANLKDVHVLKASLADPFEMPLRPLSGVLRFEPGEGSIAPVHVRGVVTYVVPNQGVYLAQGSEALLVHGTQTAGIRVGMELDAVGYAGEGEYSPSLESGTFRAVRSNPTEVKPVDVSASQMIVDKDGFSASPYDGRLVRMRGILRQAIPGSEEYVLFLEDAGATFTVWLPKSEGTSKIPEVGSLIQVTGICFTRVDSGHEARAFRLLLRTGDDVVVLANAPWWSATHAILVVAVLLVVVLLLTIWLWITHREAGLRQLALTDGLTGLYNRRGFVLLAEHQMKMVVRNRSSLLLFYIDVDNFKEINDSLGHKQGDLALEVVAWALRECFRKTDLIARLGGDEFAVSAVDALPSSSRLLEERLDRAIQQWNRKEGARFQLSLSVGVLVWDDFESGDDFETLLARADAAMYAKKRAGKTPSREPVAG